MDTMPSGSFRLLIFEYFRVVQPILSNKVIFAVDLYDKEINLGEKIEGYFREMIASENAVKECLNKYIN